MDAYTEMGAGVGGVGSHDLIGLLADCLWLSLYMHPPVLSQARVTGA